MTLSTACTRASGAGAGRAAPSRSIVFAGRHIPEKRVPAIVPAMALARERLPELRCEIFGDGPERAAVLGASKPAA